MLLGASLQYLFSRSAESRKQLRLLRTQAYSDYLRVVAKLAHVGRSDQQKRTALFSEAADAKARISVYGAAPVLSKLAAFEKTGAFLGSKEALEIFIELCQAMRSNGIVNDAASKDDLRWILFGPDQS